MPARTHACVILCRWRNDTWHWFILSGTQKLRAYHPISWHPTPVSLPIVGPPLYHRVPVHAELAWFDTDLFTHFSILIGQNRSFNGVNHGSTHTL